MSRDFCYCSEIVFLFGLDIDGVQTTSCIDINSIPDAKAYVLWRMALVLGILDHSCSWDRLLSISLYETRHPLVCGQTLHYVLSAKWILVAKLAWAGWTSHTYISALYLPPTPPSCAFQPSLNHILGCFISSIDVSSDACLYVIPSLLIYHGYACSLILFTYDSTCQTSRWIGTEHSVSLGPSVTVESYRSRLIHSSTRYNAHKDTKFTVHRPSNRPTANGSA